MKDNSFNSVFELLKFEKQKDIKGGENSTFGIFKGSISGRSVILKVAKKDYELKAGQFKKEAIISEALSRNEKISAVKILSHGENNNFRWVVRLFVEGQSLASYKPNLPLLGYDIIEDRFLKYQKEMITEIRLLTQSVNELTIDSKYQNLIISRYPVRVKDFDIPKIEDYLKIKLGSQLKFFEKNILRSIKAENFKLSVGDLTPANIIVTDKTRLVLSDYELFSIDNRLMDLTYIWLFLWRYPDWQEEIIKNDVVSHEDQVFFRVNIIRMLLFLYRWPWDCVGGVSPEEKINGNNAHIWKRYLIAAGESFEAIMKVK